MFNNDAGLLNFTISSNSINEIAWSGSEIEFIGSGWASIINPSAPITSDAKEIPFTNDLLPGNINQNFSFGGIKTLSASDYIEVYGMVNAASGNSAINQQSTFFAYKLIGV